MLDTDRISQDKDAIRWAIENGGKVEQDFYGNSKRYYVTEGTGHILYLTGELLAFARRVEDEGASC